jgi:hypothetical protein
MTNLRLDYYLNLAGKINQRHIAADHIVLKSTVSFPQNPPATW